jgi:hypothetical protein
LSLVKGIRRSISKRLSREQSIRLRLFRSAFSPRSWLAERSADVIVISYPKCGRTWLRMMLSRTLALHAGLDEIDYFADDLDTGPAARRPHIRFSHDDNPHWKTPAQLNRRKGRYRRQRVVFLVRDPRDVVVSMYFERTRRERVDVGTMSDFLDASRGSLETLVQYYNIWASCRGSVRDFLLVRYEDLQKDAASELRRLVDFVGLPEVSDAHIAEGVEFASFKNMRSMETQGDLSSGRLRPRDRNDTESYKTRRGVVGGFVDYLDSDEIERLDRRVSEELDPFYGYAVAGGSPVS